MGGGEEEEEEGRVQDWPEGPVPGGRAGREPGRPAVSAVLGPCIKSKIVAATLEFFGKYLLRT